MKKNKKLLLASIGAMSLLAVAAGSVSTVAWYQAGANGISGGTHVDAAITTDTQKTMDSELVNVTATYSMEHLGLSLATNNSVAANALVNGSPVASGDTILGYVTLSAEFANANLTDLEKTNLASAHCDVTVAPAGYVVLLSSAARTNNTNEIRSNGDPTSTTVTVTWTGSAFTFSGAAIVESNKIYFAVEPKNTNGTPDTTSDHNADAIDLS